MRRNVQGCPVRSENALSKPVSKSLAEPIQLMQLHDFMSIQVQAAIIAAVAGLATGTLGSLVAPWVQWRIETRRERLKGRTTRVNEWRAGLAEAEGYETLEHGTFSSRSFLTEPWYLSLRPHRWPARTRHRPGHGLRRRLGIACRRLTRAGRRAP
jgi:hypothetical protein